MTGPKSSFSEPGGPKNRYIPHHCPLDRKAGVLIIVVGWWHLAFCQVSGLFACTHSPRFPRRLRGQ